MTRTVLVALASGFVARDVVRLAYNRFLMWKFERDFEAANKRMLGCKHERTIRIDVGGLTSKCRDCWAILINGTWGPNCVHPDEYAKGVTPNAIDR
jgi:hypothetical protein